MGCDLPSANATILPFSSARYPTPTMSRSFLKPWVTPRTALASNARARPCSARCSSLSRMAVSTPSFCSSLIWLGTSTKSFPLGPCTSTRPPAELIFTPAGTGIGLRPIRDIALLPSREPFAVGHWPSATRSSNFPSLTSKLRLLPHFAQNLAAQLGLARGAPGHQALRRGQNADAQPAHHRLNVAGAQIAALAGLGDALHPGDHAAPVRR